MNNLSDAINQEIEKIKSEPSKNLRVVLEDNFEQVEQLLEASRFIRKSGYEVLVQILKESGHGEFSTDTVRATVNNIRKKKGV